MMNRLRFKSILCLFRDTEFLLKFVALCILLLCILLPWICAVPGFTFAPVENAYATYFVAVYGATIVLIGLMIAIVLDEERHIISLWLLVTYSALLLVATLLMLIQFGTGVPIEKKFYPPPCVNGVCPPGVSAKELKENKRTAEELERKMDLFNTQKTGPACSFVRFLYPLLTFATSMILLTDYIFELLYRYE